MTQEAGFPMSGTEATTGKLVSVPVPGTDTTIAGALVGNRLMISLRVACDNIGLSYSIQLKKLKKRSWASVALVANVAADGKVREMAMIDRDTFLMWLATLDENRIAMSARPTVAAFQREAKGALAQLGDKLFGPQSQTLSLPPRASDEDETDDAELEFPYRLEPNGTPLPLHDAREMLSMMAKAGELMGADEARRYVHGMLWQLVSHAVIRSPHQASEYLEVIAEAGRLFPTLDVVFFARVVVGSVVRTGPSTLPPGRRPDTDADVLLDNSGASTRPLRAIPHPKVPQRKSD